MKLSSASALAVLTAFLGVAQFAGADDRLVLSDLSQGDRVRFSLSSGGKTTHGTVDAVGPDEIVVRPSDLRKPLLRLSPQQMAQLEVVRGKRSHWREGALIGFFPGAVFMGLAVIGLSECTSDCDNTGPVLGAGLVGGAITGTVGGVIGLLVKGDRWVPVAAGRPKVALNLAPLKGGFGGSVSLSF